MTIDNQIRYLDPASDVPDDLGWSASADELLAQLRRQTLLPQDDTAPAPGPRGRSTARAARWLVPVAAASAGVFALSTLLGGTDAYASWTAYPTGTTVAPSSPGGQWCTTWWSMDNAELDTRIRPVLTEVRGDHTLVVGRGAGGVNALCLARTNESEPEASGGTQVWTAPTVETQPGNISMTGYGTQSEADRDPSPEDIDPAFSAITGQVGDGVTAVVVNTPQQGPVTASVVDGTFAAWWPWEMTWGDPAYPDLTFDVELADGTRLKAVSMEEIDHRPSP